jgi:hypothetical protein
MLMHLLLGVMLGVDSSFIMHIFLRRMKSRKPYSKYTGHAAVNMSEACRCLEISGEELTAAYVGQDLPVSLKVACCPAIFGKLSPIDDLGWRTTPSCITIYIIGTLA